MRKLVLAACAVGAASVALLSGTASAYSGADRDFLIEAGLAGASAGWQADGIQLAHEICLGFAGGGLTAAQVRQIGTSRFSAWVGCRLPG